MSIIVANKIILRKVSPHLGCNWKNVQANFSVGTLCLAIHRRPIWRSAGTSLQRSYLQHQFIPQWNGLGVRRSTTFKAFHQRNRFENRQWNLLQGSHVSSLKFGKSSGDSISSRFLSRTASLYGNTATVRGNGVSLLLDFLEASRLIQPFIVVQPVAEPCPSML